MTETEIINEIRRLIREPSPVNVSNTDISSVISRAVMALGLFIKEAAPSYYSKKAVLFSLSNVFDLPSDCLTIRNVWDAGTHALSITGASNESPIQITSPGHDIEHGQIVLVSGVEGNTAANGTWHATYVDEDNIKLTGSTGDGTYTTSKTGYIYDSSGTVISDVTGTALSYDHGGYLVRWRQDLSKIDRITPSRTNLTSRYNWFIQNKQIVVDYLNMSNDIIIEYNYRPTSVSDIPVDFHDGLIAYGVVRLLRMPGPKDPSLSDKRKVIDEQMSLLNETKAMIQSIMQPASEAEPIEDVMDWDSLWEY